jgi:hypothetical protein
MISGVKVSKELEQEVLNLIKENENFIEDIEEFTIIDEGEWISEGKYSYQKTIIKYKEFYFQISNSRVGSYHSDYDYNEPEISQVEPKEETRIITTWIKVND